MPAETGTTYKDPNTFISPTSPRGFKRYSSENSSWCAEGRRQRGARVSRAGTKLQQTASHSLSVPENRQPFSTQGETEPRQSPETPPRQGSPKSKAQVPWFSRFPDSLVFWVPWIPGSLVPSLFPPLSGCNREASDRVRMPASLPS